MNDLYDIITINERDDKIALLFEVNNKNLVAVNTPVGATERIMIRKLVQQGGGNLAQLFARLPWTL